MPRAEQAEPQNWQTNLFDKSGERVSDSSPRAHRGANLLNDMDTKEWLLATKSVWYSSVSDLQIPFLEEVTTALRSKYGDERAEQVLGQICDSIMLSHPPSRDPLKAQHPATFAETDIEKLIRFFSKAGDIVLDPFAGSGSALVAAERCGRNAVGVEVAHQWAEIARQRVQDQPKLFSDHETTTKVVEGDARAVVPEFPDDHFGFIVTSPPYWSVLNKAPDHKVKHERLRKGLPTRYSDSSDDLANLESYDEFLDALGHIFSICLRVLRPKRYIAVVVSDFRDKSRFHLFHSDVASLLDSSGYHLAGITILIQDSKTLYPYGMPHAFVSNIHHQYVVIGRKVD